MRPVDKYSNTRTARGYVYVFELLGFDVVKIGFTRHTSSAIKSELGRTAPGELALRAFIPAYGRLEEQLHEYAKEEHRIGEWYNYSERLKRFTDAVSKYDGDDSDGLRYFFAGYGIDYVAPDPEKIAYEKKLCGIDSFAITAIADAFNAPAATVRKWEETGRLKSSRINDIVACAKAVGREELEREQAEAQRKAKKKP